jgi:hypothetical protein
MPGSPSLRYAGLLRPSLSVHAHHEEPQHSRIGLPGRHVLRQERAKPLLHEIRGRIEAAQSVASPSSALSKACQYALTLWKKLTRFLEYPELELSNNLADNSMRPVALGSEELVTHRQLTGGSQGCGDSLGHGKLLLGRLGFARQKIWRASLRIRFGEETWLTAPERNPNVPAPAWGIVDVISR